LDTPDERHGRLEHEREYEYGYDMNMDADQLVTVEREKTKALTEKQKTVNVVSFLSDSA